MFKLARCHFHFGTLGFAHRVNSFVLTQAAGKFLIVFDLLSFTHMEATIHSQQSNTFNGSLEESKTSGGCCNEITSEKLTGALAKKRKLPPDYPSPSKSAHNDPLVCEWKSCGSGFNETAVFKFFPGTILSVVISHLNWQTLGSHVVENHIKSQNALNSYGFKCEWNGCKVNRKSFRDSWNLIVHVRYGLCPFVVALAH